MNNPALPACLQALETRCQGPRLALARCTYQVVAFDDNAFASAGITAPAALDSAVAKRRTEWLAGRVCARAALEQVLGISTIPGTAASRAPLWPNGAVGAITHCRGEAAALVGDASRWLGIGLDAEHWIAPRRAGHLLTQILTEAERPALQSLGDEAAARQLTRIFSIKESLFKTLYPLTGQRFYFQDATMVGKNRIRLRKTLSAAWPEGTEIAVGWQDEPQGVLSWVTLAR